MDHSELLEFARGNSETLERIEGMLAGLNATPTTQLTAPAPAAVAGVNDQSASIQRRGMDFQTRLELRNVLRTKSTTELHQLFQMQARKGWQSGIPFESWAAAGGGQVTDAFATANLDPETRKALDTGGAAALIRQDLEPILYELYVRTFPAWERFTREPANGLTHTYNQITSFGSAQFMSELGTVTDDTSVYVRKTANIAIVATRRGLSLKSQYAVAAGGMGYNPMDLELQGGLRAISNRMQTQIFSGQSSNSGGSSSTETGAYDANAFDGLRLLLNTSRAINVDPTLSTPEDIRTAIDRSVENIVQAGGNMPSIIWANPGDKITFDLAQDKNVRYMDTTREVAVGITTQVVNTVAGPLPLAIVPGTAISAYTTTNTDGSFSGGETVRDLYVLDESTISLPYLGSEGPTVLDIPIGVSGQLTHMFIIFGMWGLAVKAIPFSNKVRVKQA